MTSYLRFASGSWILKQDNIVLFFSLLTGILVFIHSIQQLAEQFMQIKTNFTVLANIPCVHTVPMKSMKKSICILLKKPN